MEDYSTYKHIPQIVCISSRFWVLHLLSWEFERPEVLWRYTVILACHLKHVEVGWSTRKYPHTGHLSETCTLSRWSDAVFLHEVSIGRSKEDRKWKIFIYVSRFLLSGKPWFNARKHWESKSINRNFSAAVPYVKPSCNNSNLNDIGISLQRADSGSHHFLVTGTKIFQIIWKLSENC